MRINIDGINIEYEDNGNGKPVLLLHGWMANIEVMKPIQNAIINMGMRVVSFDFPGFGKSDEPPLPFGVPEYAKITRSLISNLRLEGADVICHSFGGRIAIYLASQEQLLFNRIVLVDSAGIRPRRGIKYYTKTLLYKLGKALSKNSVLDNLFHISKKQRTAGSEDYRALKTDIMKGTFIKVVNLDLKKRLKYITRPTLIIWGTNDTATPLYMGKLMNKLIPDSGLVELKGAGHFSYVDQFPLFCKIIQSFLNSENN